MEHKFNVEIATIYGLEEAILLNNLYFWIEKNEANEKHFHDGHYWTYNSLKAFQKLFPYISKGKLERAIETLKEARIILTGNYNETAYERTTWYAITKEGIELIKNKKSISANQKCIPEIEKSISANQKYITDIKPNNNPDIKTCNAVQSNFSKNSEEVLEIPNKPTNAKNTQVENYALPFSTTEEEFIQAWREITPNEPKGGFESTFENFKSFYNRMGKSKKIHYGGWKGYLKEKWIPSQMGMEFNRATSYVQQKYEPPLIVPLSEPKKFMECLVKRNEEFKNVPAGFLAKLTPVGLQGKIIVFEVNKEFKKQIEEGYNNALTKLCKKTYEKLYEEKITDYILQPINI